MRLATPYTYEVWEGPMKSGLYWLDSASGAEVAADGTRSPGGISAPEHSFENCVALGVAGEALA